MQMQSTALPEVKLITPRVFQDERGFFLESYNEKVFSEMMGEKITFVQDNHSRSSAHVLRGLHYQVENPQSKLVRVTQGEVFDVAVDVRKNSSTFGQWVGFYLSALNQQMVWIPAGFAHGFLVLSEVADVLYKTTTFYHPASDKSLLWSDPALEIKWPLKEKPSLSPKDDLAKLLKDLETL